MNVEQLQDPPEQNKHLLWSWFMTLRRWHRAATKTVAVTLNATLRTPRNSLNQPRGQWQHSMKQFHGEGETDERYTPSWVLERVEKALNGIDLDPCADPRKRVPAKQHLTKEDDALASRGQVLSS